MYNIQWKPYDVAARPEWMPPLSGLIDTFVFCRIKQFNQEYIATYFTKDTTTRKFHKSISQSLEGAKLSVNAAAYGFLETVMNTPLTWTTIIPNHNPIFKFTHKKYRAIVDNFEIATIYKRYNKFIICHNFQNIKTSTDTLTFKTLADAKNFVEQQLKILVKTLQQVHNLPNNENSVIP